MSTEEDREALSKLIEDRSILWRFQADGLADAILAAGFHRTPAPAPDVQALIHEARILGEREWQAHWPGRAQRALSRLAGALEAAEKELAMRRSESADFERERDEADQRAQASENAIADALAWMDAGDGRLHGHPLRRILSTYEQKGTN